LAKGIDDLGPFELITRAEHLPVFAFKVKEGEQRYSVYDVSRCLREHGWLVPAYAFPPHLEDLEVLRVVVRNGFSGELADLFLGALKDAIPELERQSGPISRPIPGFHH